MKQLVIFFLVVTLISCNTSEDLTISTPFEPTVNLIFINADSLSKLNDSTTIVSESNVELDTLIKRYSDTLTTFTDSLKVITDSIAAGGMLETEKTLVEAKIENQGNSLSLVQADKAVNDSLLLVMNAVKSTINSGLLFVDEIEVVETNSKLTYSDSATSFSVPLSFDKSFKSYGVLINNQRYTIELDYQIFQELDAERNVLVRADDIMVVSHSFDSLSACEENCIDGNTTFTFSF